jgi:hypothetical protein
VNSKIAKKREIAGTHTNRSGANKKIWPVIDNSAARKRREFLGISISRIAQKSLFFYR